jgi:hypothetical protein
MKGCFWNVVLLDKTTILYILFVQNLTDVKISESKIDLFPVAASFPNCSQPHYMSHLNRTMYCWVIDER